MKYDGSSFKVKIGYQMNGDPAYLNFPRGGWNTIFLSEPLEASKVVWQNILLF